MHSTYFCQIFVKISGQNRLVSFQLPVLYIQLPVIFIGWNGTFIRCIWMGMFLRVYFVFRIAVLPHSPGVVYYHLLLRREIRIPGVAPFSLSNRNLGSFCTKGTEILYTHSLWEVVDHSRSKMHETCLIIIHDPGMRPGPESNRGPLD